MSPRSFLLDDALHGYLLAHAPAPDETQRWLIDETTTRHADAAGMQIAVDQGALLTLLARLVGAVHAVEVGTFTGYSALCLARGLSPAGRLVCCDVSEEWTAVAREAWLRAGVDHRIELRLAPAAESLAAMPDEPHLDLAFIDADKPGYLTYYELLVPRLRPGALLVADNTLWSGRVVDAATTDADTVAIRAFNDHVAADRRVESLILPVADGLTVARVRD